MKLFKTSLLGIILTCSFNINAQEQEISTEAKLDKTAYYEKRAAEDAKYEQEFKAETKTEDDKFWNDQKAYMKDLKRRDKKAYKAYMRGKRDAYAEHYEHCDEHCHHSHHYYEYASFYYYGYNDRYYNSYPRQQTVSTRVQLNTPNVRLGIL